MKTTLILLMLISSPAFASEFAYSYHFPNDNDRITENLMRLGDEAEQSQVYDFMRKLNCWDDESDEGSAAVTCENGNVTITKVDEPKVEFDKPEDPLIMVVPSEIQ